MTPFPSIAFAAALALQIAGAAQAQNQSALDFGPDVASVTFGPYARVELGFAQNDAANGYWDPAGPDDPRIFFDLVAQDGTAGAVAFGYDWQNGWRADLSLTRMAAVDLAGACSSASDLSPCDLATTPPTDNHADIDSARVSATALMVNLFYAPLEARGSTARFQPFVVGGLGLAQNEVGTWTRVNDNGDITGRTTRSFEGDSTTGLAWSLGVGASWQLTPPGRHPVILEAAWRYYDLGQARGGTTPLPGEGESAPRTPLTFDLHAGVLSVGLRIPLTRN